MVLQTRSLERWLLIAAGICLAACLLRNLGVVSPVLPGVWDKAYNGAEYLAIAVCGLRSLRSHGTERAAWGMLTLGLFGFAAGDMYYTLALTGDPDPPYPSLADAGYLSIYPAAYVGLVLLLRARAPRLGSTLWLDGLVCALAGAAIGAALVLDLVAGTDGSFAAVATNLAYPLGDLTTLAFAIAVMVITGRAAGSTWRILVLALATVGRGRHDLRVPGRGRHLPRLLAARHGVAGRVRARRPCRLPSRRAARCAPAARRHARRSRDVHADRARAARLRPLRPAARGRPVVRDRRRSRRPWCASR